MSLSMQVETARLQERLARELRSDAAEKHAATAKLDGSAKTFESEVRRIIEIEALPAEFLDGRSASFLRAYKRKLLAEQKADPRLTTADFAARLKQGNAANELNERVKKLWKN